MTDSNSPAERRVNSPDGLVLVVRDHLRKRLVITPTPYPCHYACFIHPRRREGERGFGVITLSGESLPLSVTMLESLRRMPTLLDGTASVVVGPVDEEEAVVPARPGEAWQELLPVSRLVVRRGVGGARDDTGTALTATTEGPQLTLLCAERPVGWPP